MNKLKLIMLALSTFFTYGSIASELPTSARSEKAISMVEPALKKQLANKGLKYGAPIFIRIFKDPGILEVWVESDDGTYINFKNYEICTFSGNFGPKLQEGDNQSPEGFYYVNANRLNPWSSYHLSFNLGFPNKYDRIHNRTGSALMVHGDCVSIGCYAMTDEYINEIYALGAAALKSGQPFFRVHSFPFKLDSELLLKHQSSKWYSFWLNLKEGYDYFNKYKKPPNVEVSHKKYIFN
ncbi:murein L,D-transpeptidase family protein [Pseudoalteromonas sp. SWXJZ94C]|uniref:L,D-transpeptidase family protein n=1 Tax=Pseudoalteromonas sp. SWXJZ94C TaxID=2792065 RepID=UPI001E4B81BE|nr:murein L,D-transpeptidase family protein [Pseudoalteromonas sp. SWXJZ94C]